MLDTAGLEEELQKVGKTARPLEAKKFFFPPVNVRQGITREGLEQILEIQLRQLRRWIEMETSLVALGSPFQLSMDLSGFKLILHRRGEGPKKGIYLNEALKNSLDEFSRIARARGGQYTGRIEASVQQTAEGWKVEISDDGDGIPHGTLEKLFLQRYPGEIKDPEVDLGGDGRAFQAGLFGNQFLDADGSVEVETHHLSDPTSWRLTYQPGTNRFEISPGDQVALGTTVRWRFSSKTAGAEEKLSGEEAKQKVEKIKEGYLAGAPAREVSKELSATVLALLRNVEEEVRRKLEGKVVVLETGGRQQRARAFDSTSPQLTGRVPVELAKKDVFTVVTGGLGRGDDFFFQDDVDFIVFPSNPESIPYAQILHDEMLNALEATLQRVGLSFKVDRILTGKYDFQVPPAEVPQKLLRPKVKYFLEEHQVEAEVDFPLTATPFRDLRFVSGDRGAFDRLWVDIAAPLLYPYGEKGEILNPQGHELVRVLLSAAREDGMLSAPEGAVPTAQVDIKQDALRRIQYYVWISRARAGVRNISGFEVLERLAQQGVLSSEDAGVLMQAYDFFLRARDALIEVRGNEMITKTGVPNYRIPEEAQGEVARRLGMDLSDFSNRFGVYFKGVQTIVSRELGKISSEIGINPAGAEERISALKFYDRFGQEAVAAAGTDAEQVLGWMARPDAQAVIYDLPSLLPLYVQGKEGTNYFWTAMDHFVAQPRNPFVIIPVDQHQRVWQNLGYILKDPKAPPVDNPKGLPLQVVPESGIAALRPVDVLAQIFKRRLGIPESEFLGAMRFTDKQGRDRLVLFSAA